MVNAETSSDGARPMRRTEAAEIAHYDAGARSDSSLAELHAKIAAAQSTLVNGVLPVSEWLDTRFDSVAQEEVIRHLLPGLSGGRVVQVGGTGLAALKSLLAGASEAILVTPSQGELDLTMAVAEEFGLATRLKTICAFAEEMPLADASIDLVISEASMHHTDFVPTMAEIHRVLKPGGRFGCFEPWRAPLYGVGTGVLGKRDPGVSCRPLDRSRVAGLETTFPGCTVRRHGALTRYLMIALSKFRIRVTREMAHRVTRADDWITALVPGLERMGSSVSIVATKR